MIIKIDLNNKQMSRLYEFLEQQKVEQESKRKLQQKKGSYKYYLHDGGEVPLIALKEVKTFKGKNSVVTLEIADSRGKIDYGRDNDEKIVEPEATPIKLILDFFNFIGRFPVTDQAEDLPDLPAILGGSITDLLDELPPADKATKNFIICVLKIATTRDRAKRRELLNQDLNALIDKFSKNQDRALASRIRHTLTNQY